MSRRVEDLLRHRLRGRLLLHLDRKLILVLGCDSAGHHARLKSDHASLFSTSLMPFSGPAVFIGSSKFFIDLCNLPEASDGSLAANLFHVVLDVELQPGPHPIILVPEEPAWPESIYIYIWFYIYIYIYIYISGLHGTGRCLRMAEAGHPSPGA